MTSRMLNSFKSAASSLPFYRGRRQIREKHLVTEFVNKLTDTKADDTYLAFQNILGKNARSWNLLLNKLAQRGHLERALSIFNDIPMRDVVTWNTILGAFSKADDTSELRPKPMELFREMIDQGIQPDRVTFIAALESCDNLESGKEIHRLVSEERMLSDILVVTGLVKMYSRCHSLTTIEDLFQSSVERDVILWTAVVKAYADNWQLQKAKQMFGRMPSHSTVSWNVLLTGIIRSSSLQDAKNMFDVIPEPSVVTWTAMVTAYAERGESTFAVKTFCLMDLEGEIPVQASFLSVLDAVRDIVAGDSHRGSTRAGRVKPNVYWPVSEMFASSGTNRKSLVKSIHAEIQSCGYQTSSSLRTKLIDVYGKCGDMESARAVFETTTQSRPVSSWNALLGGYVFNGLNNEALALFRRMDLEGCQPTGITFTAVLHACGILAEGKLVHSLMLNSGLFPFEEVPLMSMYARTGDMRSAERLFEKRSRYDSASWTTLIAANAGLGQITKALLLFRRMELEGIEPSEATYTSFLFGCSHGGLMEEAREVFARIEERRVDHYVCMVDLLGRLGRVEEARDLLCDMPFEPGVVAWTSFLNYETSKL